MELKHVTFSYQDGKDVLKDVSIRLLPDTVNAVVGSSGGGKTTLTHLAARFWDVDAGSVIIGGYKVKDFRFDSLMEHFSSVFQNVYLFSDTIENNIAFMKDAPIIILDEATANVDPESEEELMKAIDALTQNKTVIMIANRLKTARNAAQIAVIDHGKIADIGTHEELVRKSGIYRDLIEAGEHAVNWKIG